MGFCYVDFIVYFVLYSMYECVKVGDFVVYIGEGCQFVDGLVGVCYFCYMGKNVCWSIGVVFFVLDVIGVDGVNGFGCGDFDVFDGVVVGYYVYDIVEGIFVSGCMVNIGGVDCLVDDFLIWVIYWGQVELLYCVGEWLVVVVFCGVLDGEVYEELEVGVLVQVKLQFLDSWLVKWLFLLMKFIRNL